MVTNTEAETEELLQIRELIDKASSLGIRLEALEHENKQRIEAFIARKKAEVKNFKQSQNSAASYAKNMVNQHLEGASYFMDKKK